MAAPVTTQDPIVDEEGDGIHVDPEETMEDPNFDGEDLVDDVTEIPVHGVAAVTGKPTGDGRMFADGALSNRDLPLPMRFEYIGNHGGDTSMVVTVGTIDEMWMTDTGEQRYRGRIILSADHAPDVVSGIIDGRYKGVSVEVDDVVLDVSEERAAMKERIMSAQGGADEIGVSVDTEGMTEEEVDAFLDEMIGDGTMPLTVFSAARTCGFTIVPIPAYAEAYIALGPEFDDELSPDSKAALAASGCDCADPTPEELAAANSDFEAWVRELAEFQTEDLTGLDIEFYDALATFAISEAAWDGAASRFDDAQWKSSCILDRGGDFTTPKTRYALPIKEPNGDLSRAGVHAAASRLDQVDASDAAKSAAKAKLRSAYKTLGEDAPESLTAAAFAPGTHDGPGWITHPRATARIRRYWTHGKGAAKIRWGVPGDFNRCRKQLAKYVQNPEWLAGLCANMHKEAIGVWPGQEAGGRKGHSAGVLTASGMRLVASAGQKVPAEFFANPNLGVPTQLVVEDDGHIYGHLATWGTCHIGIPGVCTTAPHSYSGYAYFHTGVVETTDGDVKVGHLTMGIGHASMKSSAAAATAHYDRDDAVVAHVVIGEDAVGIWFSGIIAAGVSDERVQAFKANGSLSGDWRDVGGGLELVGAVAVGVPGFPIPRTQLAASGGVQTALIASGMIEHHQEETEMKLTPATVAAISRTAVEEFRHQESRAALLATVKEKTTTLRVLRASRARKAFAAITKEK